MSRFYVASDESLRFDVRWCVPDDEELKSKILTEAHCTPYSVHPGGDKLYKDLKKTFWWPKMKKEITEFGARCLVCQRVKGEHKRPQDTWSKAEFTKAYVKYVLKLYGVPKDIISDRDSSFISMFWQEL
ncbi:uncharacterized protein LOC141631297 [Silene latifolia]|uniref:uncharacterized protein LOC141631297 n=1 Tax=Silene latifolia TaxID=37657 RepID=UPI003D789C53